jgi:nucleoside-diphosphate-sugar epimerase/predicted dehydrogenase
MATFLVTGATGFIGSRFADLALEKGHTVHTLTRTDWSDTPAVPLADRYFGALPNQIPAEAFYGVDVVVHCAAATEADERASFAVNVTGTINLTHAALANGGARTFIFLSSQSAQPDATSVYGRSKYAAERALLNLSGLDVIILRPGLVCGPGGRGLFQKMCNLVEKLPVIPLLGGGSAIVQPIHVDDLCAAIFECAIRSKDLAGSTLNVGDPTGISLSDFLQMIAKNRLGKEKIALHIPLWPIEQVVRAAERLGIPLPINTNNLRGLKQVVKMETAGDLEKLELQLRPLEAVLDTARPGSTIDIAPDRRAARMLLIGGGRIGLVHALTLWRAHGIDLAGIVDSKRAALNLLKGLGLPVRTFPSAEDALHTVKPDAAVIATPASSHLALARTCLSAGLSVLVEKPLCVQPQQLEDFRRLALEFPNQFIQVGYVLPRNPQVEYLLKRLKEGEFGRVKGFLGLTLHSYILQPEPGRWEVKKDVSGGGVLINSGGHVLSMIHSAFGTPLKVEAQSLHLHSTEVEDSLIAAFRYQGFEGHLCASWSINGFQRQENRLVIWTEKGVVILTTSVGMFISATDSSEIHHQLDFNVGFNLAPDYAGAGFSQEAQDLARSVQTAQPAHMNVHEAIKIEETLFKVYAESKAVSSFEVALPTTASIGKPFGSPPTATPAKRFLDLRELSNETVDEYLATTPTRWDGFEITSSQLRETSARILPSDRLRVTVPDFLAQSRLLMSSNYVEVLKRMGASGVVRAGITTFPMITKARTVTFWTAAMGLLAGDLAHIPREFAGTLLLHGYLADLALALRQTKAFQKMLSLCGRLRPRARVGFHTNLASEADATLPLIDARIQEISVLTSPSGLQLRQIMESLAHHADSSLAVTAEVGPGPALLHQMAANASEQWTHGAEGILLGPMADGSLAKMVTREKTQAWRDAFPGLSLLPESAL